MNNEINLRMAVESDIPLIFNFIKELAEYEKLSDQVLADETILRRNLFGERKYAEIIIAEYNGEAAGQALFFHNFSTFNGKPGIYLEDLYVRPIFRGKGIGKVLLKYLINLAQERNCGRIEWAVLDWNEPAIKFYENMGAVPMKDWTIFRLTDDMFPQALLSK